jgi:DNA-binding HxlR family transcriptional regulator
LTLIFHRRWSAPILSEMLVGDTHPGGVKFITLARRLKLSRDSLHATLKHLIAHDYVMRNPGYGHPMRPEYLLAESGYRIAPLCQRLLQEARARAWTDLILRKWSMPVLYVIGQGVMRFSELKLALPSITSRALTLSLKQLVAAGLLQREVKASFPPTAVYTPTATAKPLLAILKGFSED